MPQGIEARAVLEQFAEDLEYDPQMWGIRLFEPVTGGLVWRNRAMREYYAQHGIHGAHTMPWSGVVKFFTRAELRRLEAHYRCAFCRQCSISRRLVFSAGGVQHRLAVRYLAVYGDETHGVVLTVTRPWRGV